MSSNTPPLRIKLQDYETQPVAVKAIRLNKGNRKGITRWCDGELVENAPDDWYITLKTGNPRRKREALLTKGSWLVWDKATGFQIYSNNMFKLEFRSAE